MAAIVREWTVFLATRSDSTASPENMFHLVSEHLDFSAIVAQLPLRDRMHPLINLVASD